MKEYLLKNALTATSQFALIAAISSNFAVAQTISTFAGTGTAASSGDGSVATAASFNRPCHAVFGKHDYLYITEFDGRVIRRIDPSGTVSTFAGTGSSGYTGDNGPASAAKLAAPNGIVADANGNIYFADQYNNVIRKINTSGIITTVAGNGTSGYSGDGRPATASNINSITGLDVDKWGNLYIADYGNHRIRKVDTFGIIRSIAGTGTPGFSGDNGQATAAQIFQPTTVTVDNIGRLYITDQLNNRIRKIDTSGIITTIAGTGVSGYSGDGGAATAAKVYYPSDLRIVNDSLIFFVDAYNHAIRRIDPRGIITTVAGTGRSGYSGDGGTATAATFNIPTGLAFSYCGDLFICDYNNNRIRKVTYFTTMPSIVGVDTLRRGDSTVLSNSIPNGIWRSLNTAKATVDTNTGKVKGIDTGLVKVVYSNYCGTDTFSIRVVKSNVSVSNVAQASSFTVYPNPSNGQFTVTATGLNSVTSASLDVMDLSGRVMESFSFAAQGGDLKEEINVAGKLSSGVYLIKFSANKQTTYQRIVVQ